MYIRRDYNQPFFSSRRRRRFGGRFIFLYVLTMVAFLGFVSWQFDRLQLVALDAVGLAPTPTPFASSWAQQGYDRFAQGDLSGAAQAFEQAARQQPDNVTYLYEYGRMLIELDRDAAPDAGRPVSDAEQAVQLGDQAIEAGPLDPRGYALKARALIWLDDSASAIPVALSGIEIDPNFAPLHAVLAMAYTFIGRYQQGLDYGERAVELDPMNADTHRAFAITLAYVGLYEEAIAQLEDAVNINPNLVTPYFELAGLYRARNLFEEAVATYERILSIDSRNTKALLRLCEVYSQVGEIAQAQGYCDDALTLDSNYKEAWRQLGVVQYRRRNYEGSIRSFDQCVNLGSTEVQCYYLRGLAYYYIADTPTECDLAWTTLNQALDIIETMPEKEPILSETREGLRLVTERCSQYAGQAVPDIQPTAILPTPLGVGG